MHYVLDTDVLVCRNEFTNQAELVACVSLPTVIASEEDTVMAWACCSVSLLASLSALSRAICCRTASLRALSFALSSLIWLRMVCACFSSRLRFAFAISCPTWRLSNSFLLRFCFIKKVISHFNGFGLGSFVWQKRISAMPTEWHGRPPGISL